MRVDLFDFDLPPDRIAQHPVTPRDSARMLALTGADRADRIVRDLPACLRAGDLLVCNDTRVLPTRLHGQRGAARIEVTLHQAQDASSWRAFARPARKLRPGDTVAFSGGLRADVVERGEGGEAVLRFNLGGEALKDALWRCGRMPLPPYIRRNAAAHGKEGADGEDARDRQDYQTMFARHDGAVAAPTAGLHFTKALEQALRERGVGIEAITLHVGAGTFLPVRAEQTEDHVMHSEHGIITPEAAASINRTRREGGRIVAIGTTCIRLLESAATADGDVQAFEGHTNLFMTPGYRFRVADRLLTNFHLPRSTLFMLVCAFAGLERMQAAYAHAIARGYRFYSYGDCCLLDRAP